VRQEITEITRTCICTIKIGTKDWKIPIQGNPNSYLEDPTVNLFGNYNRDFEEIIKFVDAENQVTIKIENQIQVSVEISRIQIGFMMKIKIQN